MIKTSQTLELAVNMSYGLLCHISIQFLTHQGCLFFLVFGNLAHDCGLVRVLVVINGLCIKRSFTLLYIPLYHPSKPPPPQIIHH
jgi:hypothetical protein